ncbi:hypothetical protein N7452_004937 [Penicillium brevicompactum]|uniref:Uncharacterized protein n=1 Tax=Penicillium brevicompactum TaxID=5074 RepID=A0A9W9UF80_PENBR|nr:hypothetical protein N7452_004937 [Penicillium brevicompactum]
MRQAQGVEMGLEVVANEDDVRINELGQLSTACMPSFEGISLFPGQICGRVRDAGHMGEPAVNFLFWLHIAVYEDLPDEEVKSADRGKHRVTVRRFHRFACKHDRDLSSEEQTIMVSQTY